MCRKLEYLQKLSVIAYEPQHDSPQLVCTKPREDAATLPLDTKRLATLRERALQQAREMGRYVRTTNRCRTQLLLDYFGEVTDTRCRICDYCLAARNKEREGEEMETLREKLLVLVNTQPWLPKELVQQFEPKHAEAVTTLLRELVDVGRLKYRESGKLEAVTQE